MTAHDALDRLDEVAACQQALTDLMTPDGDIQAPQRSNIAILMGYLQREQRRAIDQVRADC